MAFDELMLAQETGVRSQVSGKTSTADQMDAELPAVTCNLMQVLTISLTEN